MLTRVALATTLATVLCVGSAKAQHKYVDKHGVAHWVQSIDQVPEQYRPTSTSVAAPDAQTRAPDKSGKDRTRRLMRACRGAVLSQLKAPGSARFPSMVLAGQYRIVGEVDSHNSYGALVRGTYYCDFTRNDNIESVDIFTRR